jgi:hypothetical protein
MKARERLTLSPFVVDFDDLINDGVVSEAVTLGLLDFFWVTTSVNSQKVYVNRHIILNKWLYILIIERDDLIQFNLSHPIPVR